MLAVQLQDASYAEEDVAFPARLSQNLRKMRSRDLVTPEDAADSTMQWIQDHHEAWTSVTLHVYYEKCRQEDYADEHLAKCLLDRLGILESLFDACKKIQTVIGNYFEFSCLKVVQTQCAWLRNACLARGLDVESRNLSYNAHLIINYIEMTTMPGAELCSAVSAIWAYLLTSWIGWQRAVIRNGRTLSAGYFDMGVQLSESETMVSLMETANLLDGCLGRANKKEVFNAQKTFEEVLKLVTAHLEESLLTEADADFEFCVDCGRKGHTNSECAFRSHV